MDDVTVVRIGNILNGKARVIARAWIWRAVEGMADEVYDQVQARLEQVLVHPTGYYQSQITRTRQIDSIIVDDGGVIYGPWLEGIGSRNYPATRFKGYATFRKVTARIMRNAPMYVQKRVPELIMEIDA